MRRLCCKSYKGIDGSSLHTLVSNFGTYVQFRRILLSLYRKLDKNFISSLPTLSMDTTVDLHLLTLILYPGHQRNVKIVQSLQKFEYGTLYRSIFVMNLRDVLKFHQFTDVITRSFLCKIVFV